MKIRITADSIKNNDLVFVHKEDELPGVKRTAGYVCKDLEAIFSATPDDKTEDYILPENKGVQGNAEGAPDLGKIYYMTEKAGEAGLSGRRECYKIEVASGSKEGTVDLYITGSDKRGTIYGLFKFSELCGISPFINWGDVRPVKTDELYIDISGSFESREPSVRFRGFFINDEWPAFGNYVNKRFGGFNSKAYEKIFELLLRLKGNYLWPAMWSAQFYLDGPGLANAELADEMGVVMGASHHEPCIRNGEEYKYVRGKDSIYGDAWDFRKNKEGITRFWEDGLKRSGGFETVITVGMRGEADSTILGKNATLKDNIDLLRDVLKTQNELIGKYVNEDLDKVPRMLALYKEVEPFFYGDKDTEGLAGDPELDGVTLMLCDDNHGNLRTVPDESMRGRKGGFGMYYHYDYHGSPVSYEWTNSSAISRTWDQMTNAYESGIRELWIVNVGDIYSNEFPLSYFLEMAYDYEKWGISNEKSYMEYTDLFAEKMFSGYTDENTCKRISALLEGYTRIAHNRRPEAMDDTIYAPVAYGERKTLDEKCRQLMDEAEQIYKDASEEMKFPFYEFVYYPVMANLNLQRMWLETGYNHYLAKIGAAAANASADRIDEFYEADRKIVDELHTIHDGWWYGMGLSEHIGFRRWNEEECRNPVTHRLHPANKNRVIAVIPETGEYTEGSVWTGKTLILPDLVRYGKESAEIYLYNSGAGNAWFEPASVSDLLKISVNAEKTAGNDGRYEIPGCGMTVLNVTLDKSRLTGSEPVKGNIRILGEYSDIRIEVPVDPALYQNDSEEAAHVFVFEDDYISIEADHFTGKTAAGGREYRCLERFGKTSAGMKILPAFGECEKSTEVPKLYYDFEVKDAGSYVIRFLIAPVNPPYRDNKLDLNYKINNEGALKADFVAQDFRVTDGCLEWEQGVLDQIRFSEVKCTLKSGRNRLTVCGGSAAVVLEKIVIRKEESKPAYSYLEPTETYFR
ncbi:MAG: glycosyl hydrolase 115 family protein [Lachnospiraceae bacterium]|nr:glycosyl hydrolase 115 family protein [Lachnospiraceae bacterium]